MFGSTLLGWILFGPTLLGSLIFAFKNVAMYYTEAVIIKNKSNHGVTIQIELLFSALYTVRKVKLTLSIIMSHCVKGAFSDNNLLI